MHEQAKNCRTAEGASRAVCCMAKQMIDARAGGGGRAAAAGDISGDILELGT